MKVNSRYYENLVHPTEHLTSVQPEATETLCTAAVMLALEVSFLKRY